MMEGTAFIGGVYWESTFLEFKDMFCDVLYQALMHILEWIIIRLPPELLHLPPRLLYLPP